MAKILNIKSLFKQSRSQYAGFKHKHFLNTIESEKLNEILLFSEGDGIANLIPDFKNKRVLMINDQKHRFLYKKVVAKEPEYFVNYLTDGELLHTQSPGVYNVFGSIDRIALKNDYFDIIICPFSNQTDMVDSKIIGQFSRLLRNGGRLVLGVRHPGVELFVYNQNPSQSGSPENSISRYYKWLKDHHLYVEEIAEGHVDSGLRPFFTNEGEFDFYHDYKNIPLTLMIRSVKYIKNK